MVPQTVLGFFFFLLLVAPGVGFELLRERRTPLINETAFREAARVALYSFGFSFASLAIIALLRISLLKHLFDLGAYSQDSTGYVKAHYTAVIWTIVLEVLIAFALVLIVDQISAAGAYSKLYRKLPKAIQTILGTYIRQHGIWWDMLVASKPDGTIPWLSIRLSDGSRIGGYHHMSTAYDTFDKTEIAIKQGRPGPMLLLDTQDKKNPNGQQLDDQDIIWVRGDDISYIKVEYRPLKVQQKPSEATATRDASVRDPADVAKGQTQTPQDAPRRSRTPLNPRPS